ncbi:hypothetical protein GALMADRAFT_213563 [Galerina marginata CBS 339.88]|uniref:Uncharacterized protein n=1 Tax=Galerina marginata (strain CBS 339.88) TaxID=685588 RepID=A0A067SZD8_GALM3|nr:hypothetical protein GALMADRAFT_213563 [Galerina marginata CBS 339.88]
MLTLRQVPESASSAARASGIGRERRAQQRGMADLVSVALRIENIWAAVAESEGAARDIELSDCDVMSIKDVNTLAMKVDHSLFTAMKQLRLAWIDLVNAMEWRHGFLVGLGTSVLGNGVMHSDHDARVNMYARIAIRLRSLDFDFPGSDRIPFSDVAELFEVLKGDFSYEGWNDSDLCLLALKVVRNRARVGERTDIFHDDEAALAIARELPLPLNCMAFDLSALQQSLPALNARVSPLVEGEAGMHGFLGTLGCRVEAVLGGSSGLYRPPFPLKVRVVYLNVAKLTNLRTYKDVGAVAVKVDGTLASAMRHLEGAISDFGFAAQWRDNLLLVCRRMLVERGLTSKEFDARVALYATIAARLHMVMIGRKFPRFDVIPFTDIAELYIVLKEYEDRFPLTDFEKTLLAFQVIRKRGLRGEDSDIFRDKKKAVAAAKECLEELRMKKAGLYD